MSTPWLVEYDSDYIAMRTELERIEWRGFDVTGMVRVCPVCRAPATKREHNGSCVIGRIKRGEI